MFMLGALVLSLIALFVAMSASSRADVATRRVRALEARLAAEAAGSGEAPEPAQPEAD